MLTENLAVTTVDEAGERLISPAQVLISEYEVALGTAIALRARPTTRRRWVEATHVLLAAVHRMLVPPARDGQRTRHDYPRHYLFLENACMAREMDRL